MKPMAYYEYFGCKTVAALTLETFCFLKIAQSSDAVVSFLTSRGGSGSFAAGMDMYVLMV
jgi:hypothetical protein